MAPLKKPSDYNSGFSHAAFEAARDVLSRLKSGEPDAIESSIQFLERDAYLYGTGYVKEKMWRRLRHIALSETHKHRLRNVALHYVETHWSSEFFAMCRFVSSLGCDATFLYKLAQLEKQTSISARASLLAAYCTSVEAGENARRAMYGNFRAAQEEARQARRQLRSRPRI